MSSLPSALATPLGGGTFAITAVAPTPNTAPGAAGGMPVSYAAARATEVVVQITNYSLAVVSAVFLDGSVETVYDGSGFVGEYGSSYLIGVINGVEMHIVRTDGWPGQVPPGGNLAVGLRISAGDNVGNVVVGSFYYQMPVQVAAVPTPAPTTPVTPTAADLAAEVRSLIIWQFHS